jgi:prepilin-type processing-associated H-X9-DG protein
MYAHDNNDFLPIDDGAYQPWDLRDFSGDYLAQTGAPYKVWYDPGTSSVFTDADFLAFWNNPYVEHEDDPVLRVVGYTQTLYGIQGYQSGGLYYFGTNVNQKLNGQPFTVNGRIYPIVTSARVLTACCTISTIESEYFPQMEHAPWKNLPHDSDPDVPGTKPFTSSHLQNGAIPSGGNMGMCDGHVEWRPFREFIPRAAMGLTFYF